MTGRGQHRTADDDEANRGLRHGRPKGAGGKEMDMSKSRVVPLGEDPVCGMTVDVNEARSRGLATTHEGTEYVFCGKGCLFEFRDAPETYLAPEYTATM